MSSMPALTRRRYLYYGDIHIGTMARRVDCPVDVDPWEWDCGFYPGMEPGAHQ